MQNNSQGRRDRPDTKITMRSELPGLRAKILPVDEAAPAEAMENFTSGVVTECLCLNVRKTPSPDGDVVNIIDYHTDVMVDLERSTDEFYKIGTATGVNGFCMKKYIQLRR